MTFMRFRTTLCLLIVSIALPLIAADPPQVAVYGFPAQITVNGTTQKSKARELLDKFDLASVEDADFLQQLAALDGSSLRFVGATKGDVIRIYCFYFNDTTKMIDLKIDEKLRQPIVFDQLQSLGKFVQSGTVNGIALKVDKFQYRLTLRRATVALSAELSDAPPKPQQVLLEPKWIVVFDFTNGGKKNAEASTATVLTGPREPWNISADVPVTRLGDVKVDDKFENIKLTKTPDSFYAGFNYAPVGDALKAPASLAEAFTFKALLKASRRPFDSFGLGIGLRSGFFSNSSMPPFLKIFDTLAPYLAYTNTRVEENKTDASGNATKVHFRRNDFVVGLSLDLAKTMDLIKGEGAKNGGGSQ
jgi:hypothetical protein